MSEQPQFGKKAMVSMPEEADEEGYVPLPAGPQLRHAFADEYEGFDQNAPLIDEEYHMQDSPPPLDAMWQETSPAANTPLNVVTSEMPAPQELWEGGIPSSQPYPLPPQAQPFELTQEHENIEQWHEPAIQSAEFSEQASHQRDPDVSAFTETIQQAQETWEQNPVAATEEAVDDWRTTTEESEPEVAPMPKHMAWDSRESELVAEHESLHSSRETIEYVEQPFLQNDTAEAQEDYTPAAESVAKAAENPQDEFSAIVASHQRWLESGGRDGRRAAFRGDQFRGADFSGLLLAEASFRGASLAACRFRGANLDRADFVEADLTAADFTHSSLSGANLQRAQLSQADFSLTTSAEADFSSVEAVGATFQRAALEWSSFRDAQLGEADFRQANLSKANLRGASLFRARMEDANLTQADCREVNFDGATMDRALLLQANFKSANLQGVAMQNADFTQAMDVPMEAQVDSAQKEREWLQQEAQRIEILKAELLAKERELNLEREKLRHSPAASRAPLETPATGRVLNHLASNSELRTILKNHSKLFMKLGAGWLLIVLAVVGVMLNAIAEMDSSQLNFLELVILGMMMFVPLAIALVAVVKSMNLSSRLLEYDADHDS